MRWLRIIAAPIALIYALVVYLRNFLFDVGFFKSTISNTPTICVGNLSLGGTGKTPMIDFLVSNLKQKKKIAVLSRGYRRKSKGFQLATEKSTVEVLGDEPFQLYRKHPDVTLAVDADRVNGIQKLEELGDFDLILLDDAFQHRKVKPTLSILLTTFDKPYTNDFYLPTGSLRDAKNQSKRADLIIVTKCPSSLSKKDCKAFSNKIKPLEHQNVLFASLRYAENFINDEQTLTFEELANKKLALVTGIAKPEPLVAQLKSKELQFEHLKFKDHYFFSAKDIEHFSQFEVVLTTEKDFARLGNKLNNLYYLPIAHHFLNGGEEELLKKIEDLTKPDWQS
ncbi:tetraacyldisaccharide 4'-kinase [Croceivirga thetidis]|uniref:Tetraacyldisaccharide 4'-kinase n=1 Tax=Croceivirga thetidis TaxID=2721623 RepID=A0ABX1GWF1_9FLAO|nr:tetraacyldisaccharide 4'-kinase [Croceivirga thetidis]NKI33336.1 tetraacyldisaccharide 4'-kinase [Croceivirga thetidis]